MACPPTPPVGEFRCLCWDCLIAILTEDRRKHSFRFSIFIFLAIYPLNTVFNVWNSQISSTNICIIWTRWNVVQRRRLLLLHAGCSCGCDSDVSVILYSQVGHGLLVFCGWKLISWSTVDYCCAWFIGQHSGRGRGAAARSWMPAAMSVSCRYSVLHKGRQHGYTTVQCKLLHWGGGVLADGLLGLQRRIPSSSPSLLPVRWGSAWRWH